MPCAERRSTDAALIRIGRSAGPGISINPNEPRFSGLSFENRARLVLDGQGGRASPSALTLKHYGSRNQIAHGELQATRIDVSAFVADCYLIQAALHRAT